MIMTKEEVRRLMPRVGDRRMETQSTTMKIPTETPQACTVIEVNPTNLWYRVRFDNGCCECYKLPQTIDGGDELDE